MLLCKEQKYVFIPYLRLRYLLMIALLQLRFLQLLCHLRLLLYLNYLGGFFLGSAAKSSSYRL